MEDVFNGFKNHIFQDFEDDLGTKTDQRRSEMGSELVFEPQNRSEHMKIHFFSTEKHSFREKNTSIFEVCSLRSGNETHQY